MHELAIADSILAIATQHARGRRITRVEVRAGHLRQIVPSALTFSFELVAVGTPAEGAELSLEVVPAAGRCRACATETQLPGFPLRCGRCGGLDVAVTSGEELLVDAIEVEEDQVFATAEGAP